MRYALPPTLNEALALRAAGGWRVLAGGTDVYPGMVESRGGEGLLDVSALRDLARIERTDEAWRIGALVTFTDILDADLPPAFAALRLAARELGSVQIQNAATLAGNLCNASPAADGVPPLLVLDANVELTSPSGTRVLPLDRFILGNRRTALRADEILTAILIPRDCEHAPSHFLKLGARRYLVISIAMAAALIGVDADGRIATARVAVGACSEVARRLTGVEAALVGREAAGLDARTLAPLLEGELSPIDDVRGSAAYRLRAAGELVARTLAACTENAP